MVILFAFSFENGYIFELCNTKLSPNSPTNEIFKWYINYQGYITCLDYENSTKTTRSFKDGTYLDIESLFLKYNNNLYSLKDIGNIVTLDELL